MFTAQLSRTELSHGLSFAKDIREPHLLVTEQLVTRW